MMPQTHCFEPEANRPVVGRFAPSPTGRMHAGNIYAALTAWLVAKSQGGTIVLRIEDLDRDRSKAEYISAVQRDFELLGLTWIMDRSSSMTEMRRIPKRFRLWGVRD